MKPLLALGFALLLGCFGTRAAEALILESPLDWQVVQRHSESLGTLRVQGTAPATSRLEWRITGSAKSGELPTGWQPLPSPTPQGTFAVDLTLPAGGWYRLEVRARHNDTVVAVAQVEHVGIGEVFVVAGQSNSANYGEEKLATQTGQVSAFTGSRWQRSQDPQPGATGEGGSFIPPLGDALATQFGVPVGFAAVGVGATSVREWLPGGTRFPNPPTLTGNVRQLDSGDWESKGTLFTNLVTRLRALGPNGVRAVLWHQGESDANQKDPTRTLPGTLYRTLLEQLIRDSQQASGSRAPWFVALVSYHTPEDPGSPDLRSAQEALWKAGTALPGPDSDALIGPNRDGGGKGIHFSGAGLRAHAAAWKESVAPWLQTQLQAGSKMPPPALTLPLHQRFQLGGRPAFVMLPPPHLRQQPQPWIFYAPTLAAYPDEAERWMHEQFLAAGIAVAGIDVGEGYGSPQNHPHFTNLYQELTTHWGFGKKACLFGRSRGGLWVSSWALAHPEWVSGIIGIYPVYDFRTYPGLAQAAPAYGLTPAELTAREAEFNPVHRLGQLARAGIPVVLIHGDVDTVVPLPENSGTLVRHYQEANAGGLVKLLVLKGQGHNFYEGFFRSPEVVTFAIQQARAGAQP